jgi:hypothetical protein
VSDGAFMAAVEQVLQVYPDLSKLQAAVVAADEMDIAHDGRSFARIFGVAHALVLRQVNALDEAGALLRITKREPRTMRTHYVVSL